MFFIENLIYYISWEEFIKIFYNMLKDTFNSKFTGLSKFRVYVWIFILIYIISPFDFLPDYVIGFGQIDDVGLIVYLYFSIRKYMDYYVDWKEIENKEKEDNTIYDVDYEELDDNK